MLNHTTIWTTLPHRAKAICNQESPPGELDFLHSMFKLNSYNGRSTRLSIHLRRKTNLERIWLPWPFCPLWDPNSAASVGCYWYITSKV